MKYEMALYEDETRASPGRLQGTLLKYGAKASDRNETFLPGSLSWPPEGILLREMHRRDSPIARVLPFEQDGEIRIDAQLPNSTQRGRDAAENIRQGVYGLVVSRVRGHRSSAGVGGRREIDSEGHARRVLDWWMYPSYSSSKGGSLGQSQTPSKG